MKALTLLAAVMAGSISFMFVQGDANGQVPSTNVPATDKGIVEIVASGVGTNADIAAKEALRSAVEKVVGSAVSAETMVKNDRIILESVLTYSDGFVESWEKIGDPRKTSDGLVRVTVKARVQRTKLIQKLEAENITISAIAGTDLFAEALTKLEKEKSGEALMTKLFDGFPGSVLKAEAVGKPRLIKAGDTDATIGVTVSFAVDLQRYAQWVARTKPYLTKLASKTATVTWTPTKYAQPLGKKPFSEWWDLDGMAISRDKRKSDAWGGLSIPSQEWLRCYGVTQKIDWLVESREKHHVLALATRYSGDSVTLYYLTDSVYEAAIRASCFSIPLVSIVLKDEKGGNISGAGPDVAYMCNTKAELTASPVWSLSAGTLEFILYDRIKKDWAPGDDTVETLKQKQLFISCHRRSESVGIQPV